MIKDEVTKLRQLREHYEVATAKLTPSEKTTVTRYIDTLLSVLGHRQGESQFVKDHVDAMQIGETYQKMVQAPVVAKTVQKQNIDQQLLNAAMNSDLAAAKSAISAGADVNTRDRYQNNTPLHWAAIKDHPEHARLFIANGADIHARNKYGRTPLDMTTKSTNKLVVAVLTEAMQKHSTYTDRIDKQRGKTGGPEIGG